MRKVIVRMEQNWPVLLFRKSILKKDKFKQILKVLGPTDGLHCLDIGSDNGVFSYLPPAGRQLEER